MEQIGSRLRHLRKELGLNQGEFAEKIGLKQGSYSGIENEKEPLTWRVMRLICLEFDVSMDWLQNGGDIPIFVDKIRKSGEKELLEIYAKLMPETRQEVFGYLREKLELQELRAKSIIKPPEDNSKKREGDDETPPPF